LKKSANTPSRKKPRTKKRTQGPRKSLFLVTPKAGEKFGCWFDGNPTKDLVREKHAKKNGKKSHHLEKWGAASD